MIGAVWNDPAHPEQRLTKAQETMRHEMESQPQRLGSVLDRELGALPQDKRVGTIAAEIISRSELTLTLAQWQVVQHMVEQAVEAGQALGR